VSQNDRGGQTYSQQLIVEETLPNGKIATVDLSTLGTSPFQPKNRPQNLKLRARKKIDFALIIESEGTANTLVYVKGQGIVLREPSVVAIDRTTREVLAFGSEAKRMLGKTPANIQAVRPLRNGVIADFEVTQAMIKYFIRKVHNRRSLLHPRIVIGIPSGITEVEKRAVREAAEQAGARQIELLEEPMAAAIGSDLPISEPHGNMIVDIGGGTTEVAVISLSGMVVSKSIDVAGDEMDEAVMQYFRRKYNLVIGEATAENVKIHIGSVFPLPEEESMEVKGRDQVTGLPRTITVTSEEIRQALSEPVKLIVDTVKEALEETPPELAADLVDRGIMMAGGGALLRGFTDLLSQETDLPVHVAADPLTAVTIGCGRYLEELDNIKRQRIMLSSSSS
jgi:rod shape-determining protein MreB